MSTISKSLTILVAVGSVAQAGGALAQSSASSSLRAAQAQRTDLFARDRGVAVRDRPHPGYEVSGVPLGGFTVFPKLEIGGEYTDNVYATNTGAVDDLILRVKPELAVSSDWSRNALSAYARGTLSRFKDYETENTDEYGVGATGRLDFSRATQVTGGADYARIAEPRTSASSQTQSADPIEYDLSSAYIAASRTSGRVRLSGRGDVRAFDYADGTSVTGVNIDQDNRDRTVSSFTGRADLAVSPASAFFVQATGNERDYDVASTPTAAARDSSGYEILAGANFELGAVARGEVAVGYIDQSFDESVYGNVSGLGARALVQWFPTQLTTVTATGARTVEDSAIVGSGGYLSTSLGLQIDHELRRNVIVGAQASYGQDDYEGLDRKDDRLGASVSTTYLVNRHLGLSLTASHFEQDSSGAASGASFNINKLMVSLVTQF